MYRRFNQTSRVLLCGIAGLQKPRQFRFVGVVRTGVVLEHKNAAISEPNTFR